MTDQRTTLADATAEAVAATIGRLGGATAAAAAADIATEAGVAYSTTNKKLRLLRDAGLAESFDGGDNRTLWRLTAAAADDTDAADQPAPDGDQTDATAPLGTGRTAAVGHPDEADLDAAEDAAAGPSTVVDLADPVAAEPGSQPAESDRQEASDVPADRPAAADIVEPGPGDDTGGTASRETTSASDADSDSAQTDPGHAATASAAAPTEAGPPAETRRASGSLDGAVMDILEANPDDQYKVGQLCKLIDQANEGTGAAKASPGAVVLACQRLVGKGKAVLAVERPATFQLAPPTT